MDGPVLSDLSEAQDYIARDNPSAAEVLAKRVWEAANNLGQHPEIGPQGHVQGTREWPVSQTPYLICVSDKRRDRRNSPSLARTGKAVV
jgi:plasmid stabilization system protein ParE